MVFTLSTSLQYFISQQDSGILVCYSIVLGLEIFPNLYHEIALTLIPQKISSMATLLFVSNWQENGRRSQMLTTTIKSWSFLHF